MNTENKVVQVPIDIIVPNRFQPRLTFDDRGLVELANSIKEHGIIQPLILRKVEDKYEIVAGERRFKAARMANLTTVPAIITNMDDNKSAEVAIVENVQRRNLSAIEEARSYKNLLDKGVSQSELAKKMGVSQSAIANKLRLLNLDEEVQEAILNNQISERHARSLLVLENPEDQKVWLHRIIAERLTVRELDDLLKKVVKDYKEDENDVPLVKEFDLEAMKKQAEALPDISQATTNRLNQMDMEKRYNPDVVPVELSVNNSKDNFFNFLENETVNMNMDDNMIKEPQVNVNVLETPQMPEAPKEVVEMPKYVEPTLDMPKSISDFSRPEDYIEPKVEQFPTIDTNISNKAFDPTSLIDRLDPNYQQKVEASEGRDLKTAINTIRDTKDKLAALGFNISLEETSLLDTYQFVIKIKKD